MQIEWRLGFKEERGPDLSRITPGLVGGRRARWKGSQSGSGGGAGVQSHLPVLRREAGKGNGQYGMTSAKKS